MKMLKQFLLVMLAALTSYVSASAYDFSAVNADGKTIYYDITSSEGLTCAVVKSNSGTEYRDDIVIPSSASDGGKTYSVTSIAERAFYYCYNLTSVTIPNSVTTIGREAFCSCSKLETVSIGNSVKTIDWYAFEGSGLNTLTIPNSVESIGRAAFRYCRNMTIVDLPESVQLIESDAFGGCTSLTAINVNSNNPNYCSVNGVLFNKDKTRLEAVPASFTEFEIPESVEIIGAEAFNSCPIVSLVLPKSITEIGYNAFVYCENFKEIISLNPIPPTIDNFYSTIMTKCTVKVQNVALDVYKEATGWKDLPKLVGLNLMDGEQYNQLSNVRNIDISYIRNFENKSWQPLYIPFSMKYDDWADKADVAYINNVHQWDDDKDGEIDRTMLEFITKKSGEIEANKPYVIRPKQTGDVTFTSEDVTLYAAPETDGFVDCMSTTTKYTLYGTYQEKTDMYKNGYYAMSDGDFMQAENSSVTLAPFRIYMKIESRTGNGSVQNAPKKVKIMVDGIVDGEATGLEGIIAGGEDSSERYNLAGQKVSSGYKGIVIKNGRKYLMK